MLGSARFKTEPVAKGPFFATLVLAHLTSGGTDNVAHEYWFRTGSARLCPFTRIFGMLSIGSACPGFHGKDEIFYSEKFVFSFPTYGPYGMLTVGFALFASNLCVKTCNR